MIERTLILIKPDGVQRGLIGDIVSRFEKSGLKVIGMKMLKVDAEFAKRHYTEDLAIRRGEQVRKVNIDFISSGPVVAIALEGVNSIENVRKMVGPTEPKTAPPGTIRGDFAHVSYAYADEKQMVIKNVIHASADKKDADHELGVWFKPEELQSYKSVHDVHML